MTHIDRHLITNLTEVLESQRRAIIVLCGRTVNYDPHSKTVVAGGHTFVLQIHEDEHDGDGYWYQVGEHDDPASASTSEYAYDHMKCSLCGVYEQELKVEGLV
jgi:hypothetical protein